MFGETQRRNTNRTARGVSPVIGVVLMVGITLVLAAVIGAFVIGMVPDTEPAPVSTILIDGQAGSQNVTLEHNGGDPVPLSEIEVLADGDLTAGNDSITGTLRAGEQQTVKLSTSGTREIVIRHRPSGEVIARETVTIDA